jgi:hypothetical protein
MFDLSVTNDFICNFTNQEFHAMIERVLPSGEGCALFGHSGEESGLDECHCG